MIEQPSETTMKLMVMAGIGPKEVARDLVDRECTIYRTPDGGRIDLIELAQQLVEGDFCTEEECEVCIIERFEASSQPREEDDQGDTMGTEYDPMRPGIAESWFRQLRGE